MAAADANAQVVARVKPAIYSDKFTEIPKSKFAFLVICFFISTSPILDEIFIVSFMVLSMMIMLFAIKKFNSSPTVALLIFFFLISPITIFDLSQSLSQGFVTLSFLAIPIFILFGFILSQYIGAENLLDVYEKIVLCLAIPSSIVYFVFFAFPDIAYIAPEYSFREHTHRTFFILNILMNPDPVMRNAGFASEPGFYQILINVALYARLKRLSKPDFICIFYAALVFSTLSTAGIVVTAFLLSTVLKWQYRLMLVIVTLIFLGVIQEFVLEQYKVKVENDIVFDRRFTPSINAFLLFLQEPLGIGAVEYIKIYEAYDIGSWDSFSQVALRYGVPGIVGLAVLFSSLAKDNPVLLCLLCLSFLTSPIWFYPAIAILYFSAKSD